MRLARQNISEQGQIDDSFDAYGQSPDSVDPVGDAISQLCQQMHEMDKFNKVLLTKLSESGVDLEDVDLPKIDTDCIELDKKVKNTQVQPD